MMMAARAVINECDIFHMKQKVTFRSTATWTIKVPRVPERACSTPAIECRHGLTQGQDRHGYRGDTRHRPRDRRTTAAGWGRGGHLRTHAGIGGPGGQ